LQIEKNKNLDSCKKKIILVEKNLNVGKKEWIMIGLIKEQYED